MIFDSLPMMKQLIISKIAVILNKEKLEPRNMALLLIQYVLKLHSTINEIKYFLLHLCCCISRQLYKHIQFCQVLFYFSNFLNITWAVFSVMLYLGSHTSDPDLKSTRKWPKFLRLCYPMKSWKILLAPVLVFVLPWPLQSYVEWPLDWQSHSVSIVLSLKQTNKYFKNVHTHDIDIKCFK